MLRRGLIAGALVALVVGAFFAAACAGDGATSSDAGARAAPTRASSAADLGGASANLGGAIVARVGDRSIADRDVLAVARARHLGVFEATQALVDESLYAEAATRAGALQAPGTTARVEGILARALAAKLDDEALAKGPITDDELATVMGDDWVELSRPETRLVVHALVRAEVPDGAAIAERLRDRLIDTKTPAEFMSAAKAFPDLDDKQRVVEELPEPFTRDGRVADANVPSTLDETFAAAAFAIPEVGGTSAVVKTGFGWHVIRLVAIHPPFDAPREKKLEKLQGKVIALRLGDRYTKLVESLRATADVKMIATDEDLRAPKIDVPQLPKAGP